MLATHQFRDDLYFRLAEITVTVPPLREREGDAILLAHAFATRIAPERALRFSADAIEALTACPWPGNVRELESLVKRACIMVDGTQITARDLALEGVTGTDAHVQPLNLKQVRDEAERGAVVRALRSAQNNLAQAARLLGISRPTLYNLLERFGIDQHEE
jgi:two-component system NtrC family response regulator